jgi:uncharacterized protein YjbI with pentapeptide repeats
LKLKKGWNEMAQYTYEELKEILDLHKKWLNDDEGGARADLRYADLSSANLRYADLRYADLRSANLRYADLSSANLRYADLRYADLSSANLRYADLRYADLRSANLRYADLSSANLRYADLRYADLSSANLRYANLRYADLRYAVGEMRYVKSLQCEKYYISYTATTLNIGCQSHTILEWQNFDDDAISKMDGGALEWWQKRKPILMNIIEASPALENEDKE